MRLLHAIWPALLLPVISIAQTGPAGVGSSATNILWLDANYHVTVASGAVSSWSDRSGNGNNAAQTVAAQRPVLTGSVFNGYPAIQFDNDQTNYDFLRVPDNSTLEGMSGLTGFVVYQLLTGTSANAPRCFFSKRDGVDTQEAYDWFLWNSGANVVQNLDINNTDHRATSSGNYVSGTNYINSFTYHGAAPSDANDQILYDGNTAVGNRSEGATSIPNYTSDLYVGILRGHTGSGANTSRFNGYIGEIILYNTVLNDAQRIIVNNYLAAKYGIALTASDVYRQDEPTQGNYDHDVAGIGRTTSGNTQTDSRSGILQISSPTDLGDNEFLMWGHDAGSLGTFGVYDLPTGLQGRWQRTWRTSEINASNSAVDVGAVDISFDLSAFASVTTSDLRLLVDTDNDGVFADETPISGATSLGSGRYRFSGITALTNNVRFTLGTINVYNTPLPVELLAFSGDVLDDDRAQLNWSTASENGSAYFAVERSTDLVQWDVALRQAAAGHSSTVITYTGIDETSLSAATYFRLRQVDLDGTTVLSNVIALEPRTKTEPVIWPNPATDHAQVAFPGGAIEQVELVDHQGRIVQVAVAKAAQQISLPLYMLRSGHYLLRLWTTNGPIVRKLVIEGGSH